mgnify:CR=1 FL=1
MTTVISLSMNADDWIPVNDGVMGGVSIGNMVEVDSTQDLRFQGELSLENNGGFSSVRHQTNLNNIDSQSTVAIKLKGDGKKYQFTDTVKPQDRAYYIGGKL